MVKKYISVMRWNWSAALMALVITGCTVTPSTSLPPVEERGAESGRPEPARSEEVVVTPIPAPEQVPAQPVAIATLIARADTQQHSGDLAAAAATLERALRIDPGNAKLWSELASVRLAQGQFWQAEGLAAKSNSLARNDFAIQARNWRMIANARRAERDLAGARQADQMADSLDARAR